MQVAFAWQLVYANYGCLIFYLSVTRIVMLFELSSVQSSKLLKEGPLDIFLAAPHAHVGPLNTFPPDY